MAKNQAIVVGINEYKLLQPLKYAKRDAELMRDFLLNKAGFERVFFFSEDAPRIGGKSTEPFRSNLMRVMRELFHQPFMEPGDNFWFFFSGHGIRQDDRDYLMPLDADPGNVEHTGIATNDITERLQGCGADNVVFILDACRSGGRKSGQGVGRQTEDEARRKGIISIFSCSPDQYSYEIDSLQQGAFTTALLEGLGDQGRCATVERLNQYLEARVPEIVLQHYDGRAQQSPYMAVAPLSRSHLILMPQYAGSDEILVLKDDALQAESVENMELSKQLWTQVSTMAKSGQHRDDAVKSLVRIETKLKQIRDQKKLNELYREATQLHQARQWQAVIDIFKRIHQIDGNHPDPRGLLTSSGKQKKLSDLYRQGKRYINAEQWFEALRQFEEIQQLEPDYRDVESLIAGLQEEDEIEVSEVSHSGESKLRSLLKEVKRLPTLAVFAIWLFLIITAANIKPETYSLYSLQDSGITRGFIICGLLGGLIDGFVTGISSKQEASSIQWRKVLFSSIIGASTGFFIWWIAGILRENGKSYFYDYLSIGLTIIGAILCKLGTYLFNQKLSQSMRA